MAAFKSYDIQGMSPSVLPMLLELGYTEKEVGLLQRFFLLKCHSKSYTYEAHKFTMPSTVFWNPNGFNLCALVMQLFYQNDGKMNFEQFMIGFFILGTYSPIELFELACKGCLDADNEMVGREDVEKLDFLIDSFGGYFFPPGLMTMPQLKKEKKDLVTKTELFEFIKSRPSLLRRVKHCQYVVKNRGMGRSQWKAITERRKAKYGSKDILEILASLTKKTTMVQELTFSDVQTVFRSFTPRKIESHSFIIIMPM